LNEDIVRGQKDKEQEKVLTARIKKTGEYLRRQSAKSEEMRMGNVR
jgi:hypothetical protein